MIHAFALFLLVSLPIITMAKGAGATAGGDPQSLIAGNTEKLLMALQERGEQIKQNEKLAYDLSNELVVPHLDFPRITRLVIGKHWRKASDTQKNQLVEQIRQMLIRSYVTAMRAYADNIVTTGKSISYKPSRYKPNDKKAAVRAVIKLEDSTTVEVQYMLYLSAGAWKIYDIRVSGISLAVTYRTSFNTEIKRAGLDGLLSKLIEQNQKGTVEFPGEVGDTLSDAKQL